MRKSATKSKGAPAVAVQRLVRGTSRPALQRLQRICQAMARAPHGITAKEIAILDGMEVNAKTIYRDIDRLRQLGVSIDSQYDGWPIRGYALHDSRCPFCN